MRMELKMMGNVNKSNKTNEYILRRHKKKRRKKLIIFSILLISILVTLCFKHPFFNVKIVEVKDNKSIKKESIIKSSQISNENNIFYLNLNNVKNNIMSNPYILDAHVKRKLPNKIVIHIKERVALYYIEKDKKFYIIDNNGYVLEKKDNIKNMKLVKVDGIKKKDYNVGEPIFEQGNIRKNFMKNLASLIDKKDNNYEIAVVNIENMNNIQLKYRNIQIIIGDDEDLDKKLNKAFSILLQKEEIRGAKEGYINVSFKGNPVVFIK
ncbi:cell division protein FtsQ [Clostridium tetani]|nr:cell division protein FtsQ [Clostridium tetani]RXM78452.1 cell division protein FtsQ [Clostridium tetani]RYU99948.1 cell division protein FtsQ [Clostridium tetani]